MTDDVKVDKLPEANRVNSLYNGILVPVRTSFVVCVGLAVKCAMYRLKVDVDMLNAVKNVLADVSSVSPSSEQRGLRVRRVYMG